MTKQINWHENHYSILNDWFYTSWILKVNIRAKKKVSHVIKCKFETHQLN